MVSVHLGENRWRKVRRTRECRVDHRLLSTECPSWECRIGRWDDLVLEHEIGRELPGRYPGVVDHRLRLFVIPLVVVESTALHANEAEEVSRATDVGEAILLNCAVGFDFRAGLEEVDKLVPVPGVERRLP